MNFTEDHAESLGKPSFSVTLRDKINRFRGSRTIQSYNARPMKMSHRIIISVLSLICVMMLSIFSIGAVFLSRINHTDLDDMNGTGGEWKTIEEIVESDFQDEDAPSYEEVDSLDEVDVPNGQIIFDEDIVNIMLIGADNSDGTSRSDSMMIVSVDYRNKQIKLTSLMRDMYVSIPGKTSNRINSAYNWGGAKLLLKTIEHNFKIKIDNVVILDFDAFKKFIDKTNGITVYLNEKQAKYMTRYAWTDFPSAGTYRLNGKCALEYVRMRKVDSDFGRTSRQRGVFEQIFNKIKGYNAVDLANLAYDMLDYVETDLTNRQIIALLSDAPTIAGFEVKQFSLPAKGTYKNQKINGAQVLVCDVHKNAKLMADYVYSGDFNTSDYM